MECVGRLCRGLERVPPLVRPGPDLIECNGGPLSARLDDLQPRLQAGLIYTLFGYGAHGHHGFVADAIDHEVDFLSFVPSHRLPYELRPEFAVARPCQPVRRPAILHVGCERGSLAEPVVPAGENRCRGFRLEEHFGVLFGLGAHVAPEGRRRRHIDARECLHAAGDGGLHGLFDQGLL